MQNLIHNVTGQWQVSALGASETPHWQTDKTWQAGLPLCVTVDVEPEPVWQTASLIGIDFPAFTDGRGLSLATLIRRIGYKGDLRALGAIHEDVLHYMVRCGFTSFLLPEDCDPAVALACIAPYTEFYQGSVIQPAPLYQRRARG